MNPHEREVTDWDAERTMAFKRIDEKYHVQRRRTRERLKWLEANPSPRTAEEKLRNLKAALKAALWN